MPKSVKEILIEQEHYDSLKRMYSVADNLKSAISDVSLFRKTKTIKNESIDLKLGALEKSLNNQHTFALKTIKDCGLAIQGLTEAKQFEDDFAYPHFSHGLITCYVDPATNRFVLTKDSRSGLRNYDVISLMTKNDIKNIIKCCTEMLADIKSDKVPDEEEDVHAKE